MTKELGKSCFPDFRMTDIPVRHRPASAIRRRTWTSVVRTSVVRTTGDEMIPSFQFLRLGIELLLPASVSSSRSLFTRHGAGADFEAALVPPPGVCPKRKTFGGRRVRCWIIEGVVKCTDQAG